MPIIFVGTVVGLDSREITGERGSYSQRIRFEVTESFKGPSKGNATVLRVHAATSCPSSAPDFALGGQYLVWAFQDDTGNPVVPDCTGSRRLQDASQLVSELRELQEGGGATYIFGGIYRSRQHPNGIMWDELQNYSDVPLANVRVLVSGGESRYPATTDENGLFVVSLPGAGTYRVDTDLPRFLTKQEPNSGIDLAEHQCADMSVWTQYDFSFSGRVVDAQGNPLEGIPISLLPESDRRSVAHTFTNLSGEYMLSASEPGKYIVALNWDEAPSEAAPFPTTLYPGVGDVAMATILQTSETAQVELADLHLSRPTACKVQFRVEERNGVPAKEPMILIKYFSAQFWHQIESTSNLVLAEDAPVYVAASRSLSTQEELRSDEIEIRSCPAQPVVLRLSHNMKIE